MLFKKNCILLPIKFTMSVETNYLKKLSILLDLIDLAKVDGLVQSEYDFLLEVAEDLGVDAVVLDSLFQTKIERIKPGTETEKVSHFCNLIKLMNVDDKQSILEINKLHKLGLSMGLSPMAIQQVLSIMHNYPNKEVPLSVIEEAFKAQQN